MITRYGIEDSVSGIPPLPQAGCRSFSDARGEVLPSVSRNGGEESLEGVVVGNAGLLAEDRTPWRGWFPEPMPVARLAGDRFVAADPCTDAGIVPRKFLARRPSCGPLKDVPPQ
jgi:hypothetical protein